MVFGLGRKSRNEQVPDAEPVEAAQQEAAGAAGEAGEGTDDSRSTTGPFDISEITSREGYVDLGALLIAPSEGLQLRLEIEEKTQRVIAVTLDLNGSSLQLQAFAAPKSEGLWDDIREQIGQSVGSQGGQVEEIQGGFGTELVARLPAAAADGSQGYRVARFIGVDGPRWFLRGVLGGAAALEPQAAQELEALFRRVVVIRGDSPMPPRDLLPLRLPKDTTAQPQTLQPEPQQPEAPQQTQPRLQRPERGPETTHIG
ncbi:DUF3710 domain-containing protein [Pseudarthrobacter sp. J75]|uniref:DUF3710 domain-containing protein n=1 Tax=unclassified Pseudarthrobacter TaxID=2647000 RepID=UPI002E81216E|nr:MULTISPECIES: DUF3710 domain-containing protein [unclassified Pseudarthrobacter]MEE2522703.1 DUF3710 domain-containing protein [Pseudarthrobacter sp. J47]MEE2529564.1 DUF3710 domain-containing protein [Pseudarthrobacter sp. J75]MEE2569668.1 DUF3710 domain-containing protein [Pseudarthrobacter sp. J64]